MQSDSIYLAMEIKIREKMRYGNSHKKYQIHIPYRWQRVKTSHKQNVQETQKNVSKQTRIKVFATSIFAIFIDSFEF